MYLHIYASHLGLKHAQQTTTAIAAEASVVTTQTHFAHLTHWNGTHETWNKMC